MHGNFASRIELLLETRSVRSLSRATGLSETVIRAYKKGSDPSRRALVALSGATGAPLPWLAAGEGPGPRTADADRALPGVAESAGVYKVGSGGTPTPVRDRRLASLIAWIAETWETSDEFARGGWYARFIAAFPEARGGQATLARVVAVLGWRVIEGKGCAAPENRRESG